jgi:hypothetical protein
LLLLAGAAGATAQPSAPRLDIVRDEGAAAFRFMIDGAEVAHLDESGLYVRGDIVYGGTLTDAGTAYFDRRVRREEP